MTGSGDRFGESLLNGNRILDDLNQRMPQIRYDDQRPANLADVYPDASPDLWDGLESAVPTARTFNDHHGDIDSALMAAIGFANTAAESFDRGGPYLVRGAADFVPTTKLLDDYRGKIFCTLPSPTTSSPGSTRVRQQRLLVGDVVRHYCGRGQPLHLP